MIKDYLKKRKRRKELSATTKQLKDLIVELEDSLEISEIEMDAAKEEIKELRISLEEEQVKTRILKMSVKELEAVIARNYERVLSETKLSEGSEDGIST